MPRDHRSYDERHAHDTYPNNEHQLLKVHFPEYLDLTEACQALCRAELERYPINEFRLEVRKYKDGLLGFCWSLIEMHHAWGVQA